MESDKTLLDAGATRKPRSSVIDLSSSQRQQQTIAAGRNLRPFDDGRNHAPSLRTAELANGIIRGTGAELVQFQVRLAQIIGRAGRGDLVGTQAALRQEIGFIQSVMLATSSDLLLVLQQLAAPDPDLESTQRGDQSECEQRDHSGNEPQREAQDSPATFRRRNGDLSRH